MPLKSVLFRCQREQSTSLWGVCDVIFVHLSRLPQRVIPISTRPTAENQIQTLVCNILFICPISCLQEPWKKKMWVLGQWQPSWPPPLLDSPTGDEGKWASHYKWREDTNRFPEKNEPRVKPTLGWFLWTLWAEWQLLRMKWNGQEGKSVSPCSYLTRPFLSLPGHYTTLQLMGKTGLLGSY